MADPTPKADGLRKMREATRGHLQATANIIHPILPPVVKAHRTPDYVSSDIRTTKPARKRKNLKRKTS